MKLFGKYNPMFGKHWSKKSNESRRRKLIGRVSTRKGMTYEEFHGVNKAEIIKSKLSGHGSWNEGLTKFNNPILNKISKINSLNRLGKLNPNYGKSPSIKTRKKISASNMNHPVRLETREKVRLAQKRLWKNKNYKSKMSKKLRESWTTRRKNLKKIFMKKQWLDKTYRDNTVRKILKGIHNKPNSFEKQIIELSKKHKLPYKFVGDGKFILAGKNPDFINCNGHKKIIETYASYWHPKNYVSIRKKLFLRYGYETIFLSEKDLMAPDWENKCLVKILNG